MFRNESRVKLDENGKEAESDTFEGAKRCAWVVGLKKYKFPE